MQHRSRAFVPTEVAPSNLFVCMEPCHADALISAEPSLSGSVVLLGMWGRPRRPYIFDPYGMAEAEFTECFSIIEAAVAALLAELDGLRVNKA